MTVVINGTTGITSVNGSAGAPSVTGADTDTGIVYGTNTLSLATGGVAAVTVDSSQNVGIGTSSMGAPLSFADTNVLKIQFNGNAANYYGISKLAGSGNLGDGEFRFTSGNTSGGGFTFSSGGTERARIDSSGKLVMATSTDGIAGQIQAGVTANTGSVNGVIAVSATSNGAYPIGVRGESTTQGLIGFFNSSNTLIGSVFKSTNTVAYNTSSDYRLKENIQPMQDALSVVAALKPCTYTWKDGGFSGQGFIAHELQAVVPDCVTGEKDALDANGNPVYQGIDTSFLVATLTAAIQEQQALITQLRADVEALKAAA